MICHNWIHWSTTRLVVVNTWKYHHFSKSWWTVARPHDNRGDPKWGRDPEVEKHCSIAASHALAIWVSLLYTTWMSPILIIYRTMRLDVHFDKALHIKLLYVGMCSEPRVITLKTVFRCVVGSSPTRGTEHFGFHPSAPRLDNQRPIQNSNSNYCVLVHVHDHF